MYSTLQDFHILEHSVLRTRVSFQCKKKSWNNELLYSCFENKRTLILQMVTKSKSEGTVPYDVFRVVFRAEIFQRSCYAEN